MNKRDLECNIKRNPVLVRSTGCRNQLYLLTLLDRFLALSNKCLSKI